MSINYGEITVRYNTDDYISIFLNTFFTNATPNRVDNIIIVFDEDNTIHDAIQEYTDKKYEFCKVLVLLLRTLKIIKKRVRFSSKKIQF
jgi:hypothetical protein